MAILQKRPSSSPGSCEYEVSKLQACAPLALRAEVFPGRPQQGACILDQRCQACCSAPASDDGGSRRQRLQAHARPCPPSPSMIIVTVTGLCLLAFVRMQWHTAQVSIRPPTHPPAHTHTHIYVHSHGAVLIHACR